MRINGSLAGIVILCIGFLIAACSLVEGDPGGDPGESNISTNSGTLIIEARTVPSGQAGAFQFTGVPTGTVTAESTLIVSDLEPGTYTSTEVDPAPDYDLTAVDCDDDDSTIPSSGDAGSRTAVFNLDAGETVRCVFTNAQRGTLVIAGRTEPDAVGGQIQFTGVPSGTIPTDGTLVTSNLSPGTYSSTEVDPAPEFDLTEVSCDDAASSTVSSGDASTRTAIFNLDPGEMVTCTFVNTRRGTLIVQNETDGVEGVFQYTGVPTGTVSAGGSLIVSNLSPGTYTSTEIDPAPDFELTSVICDDDASLIPSAGDATTRSAIFNLDPGETVSCTFSHEYLSEEIRSGATVGGGGSNGGSDGGSGGESGGLNPFTDPDEIMENFPIPEELPPDAGTFLAPRPGPWSVTHFGGEMSCDAMSLAIPASPPESGVLEVQDGGRTVTGTGLEASQSTPITMRADPELRGRYKGVFDGMEQGVPVVIDFYWQVVTDEYMVGYLTTSMTAEGVTCGIYRPFEMRYTG